MISGRRRSVIFFTVLGICLVAVAVTLNISWVILNWRLSVLTVLSIEDGCSRPVVVRSGIGAGRREQLAVPTGR